MGQRYLRQLVHEKPVKSHRKPNTRECKLSVGDKVRINYTAPLPVKGFLSVIWPTVALTANTARVQGKCQK